MNNSVFGKTIEDVRNHRGIKLVTLTRKNKSSSEPNYHTTKRFLEKLLATKMNKASVKMSKSVHLGLSNLHISKIVIRCIDMNM